jgi:hypothetical protein
MKRGFSRKNDGLQNLGLLTNPNRDELKVRLIDSCP